MNAIPLAHINDAKSAASLDWLERSVKQFFTAFNWEDHPPEVQQIRQTSAQGDGGALSLTLSVQQFFAAIPWDGSVAAPAAVASDPLPLEEVFTLDDFSDLF